MVRKRLVIDVEERFDQQVVAFELDGLTKDEAIVVLHRCLFRLVSEYD